MSLMLAAAAVTAPLAATPLTVDDAIERALSSNAALAIDRYAVESRELRVAAEEEAFAVRIRPTIGYTSRSDERYASYGVAAEKLLSTGTTLGAAVTRNEGRLATGDPFAVDRVSIELRQPLFRNLGVEATTAALATSEADRRRIIREYDQARADLALRVVREYTDATRIRAQVAVWRDSLRRVEMLHRVSRRQRRLDTLQTEMLRVEAENRLRSGIDALETAERTLVSSLGFAPDARVALAPLRLPERQAISGDEALETAFAHRLDYAQVLDDQSMALRAARRLARNRYPDLSLFVRFQHFTEPLSAAEVAAFGGGGVAVGLTGGFDTTVAARGIERHQGENRVQAVNAEVEAVMARIDVEVRGLLDAYHRAFRDAESAEVRVGLARRRADLARRLFRAGRADADAVANAEVALTAADSARLSARAEAVVQTYALAHGMGTMIESMPEGRR